MPKDQVPPVRLKWCHLSRSASGELQARCSKVPSDLEAGVGYHVDNHHPGHKERVFGYLHLKTTDLHPDFALELPLGNSTYAAGADEGSEFIGHRSALAMPVLPGQIQLGDAAYDQDNYHWVNDQGGIALFAYNRRNEHVDAESLLSRGYDPHGAPYAPCGRLCHSNGYDYQAQSRQYVCGLQCPPEEQQRCPHRHSVLGYCHRMSFQDHPRLIGPIERGSQQWRSLYASARPVNAPTAMIKRSSPKAVPQAPGTPCVSVLGGDENSGPVVTTGLRLCPGCDLHAWQAPNCPDLKTR